MRGADVAFLGNHGVVVCGAPHRARDALAFRGVERQAVVVRVDGDAAVEAHRVLGQRGVERALGGQRQRAGAGHVGVQHAGLAAQAMDRGVNEHRGRLDLVAAGQPVPRGVDQHHVVGAHLAPQQAARVEQEAPRAVRQLDAEVVADALGQPVVRGGAQREREVAAQAGDGLRAVVPGVSVGGGHRRRSALGRAVVMRQGRRRPRPSASAPAPRAPRRPRGR